MNAKDVIIVSNFVNTNKNTISEMTRSQALNFVRENCKQLTGRLTMSSYIHIEQQLEVPRKRGGINGTESKKDRPKIIAKELVKVMESLGVTPSTDLIDIIKSK